MFCHLPLSACEHMRIYNPLCLESKAPELEEGVVGSASVPELEEGVVGSVPPDSDMFCICEQDTSVKGILMYLKTKCYGWGLN